MRDRWADLLDRGDLVCHPVFALELLHNALDPTHYRRLRTDLDEAFDWVWPDAATAQVALRMQQRMATRVPTGQRVKSADLLTAALAVQHGLGVVHYDSDYDVIRERGGEAFRSEWLGPRGALETAGQRALSRRRAYRMAFGTRMAQLGDDADLEVWPELIAWMDTQLHARGCGLPPSPRDDP